jgi:uncharacterized oxidoreductase
MELSGNTILITGGGSGIGSGLAKAFHSLGNQVVIAGRRQAALDHSVSASPGMRALQLDVEKPSLIPGFAARAVAEFPSLNVLINNAGIMRRENLLAQKPGVDDAVSIVATNLLGPIRLTAALLPHLLNQPRATIINVASGLAFLPMTVTPTYCATKAAIHSYTQSLRHQLRHTSVEVLELIPPYVQTDLMDGAVDSRAMPLGEFIAEVMEIFKTQPTPAEICVENVRRLRHAAENRTFDQIFNGMNSSIAD